MNGLHSHPMMATNYIMTREHYRNNRIKLKEECIKFWEILERNIGKFEHIYPSFWDHGAFMLAWQF